MQFADTLDRRQGSLRKGLGKAFFRASNAARLALDGRVNRTGERVSYRSAVHHARVTRLLAETTSNLK